MEKKLQDDRLNIGREVPSQTNQVKEEDNLTMKEKQEQLIKGFS